MNQNLHGIGSVIVDVLNLNLALSVSGENRLDQRLSGGAERELRDGQ